MRDVMREEPVGGFVLLYRRILDNPVFRTHAEAMAFGYLVMRASWRPVKVRYKDRYITLERGQLALSVRDFATAMERSKSWADRFLRRLAERDMIGTVDGTGVNVITICNYGEYQVQPWMSGTATDARPGQDRDRTGTQNKEGNKGKEGIEEKEKEPIGSKKKFEIELPEWMPAETWAAFLAMRLSIKKPAGEFAQRKLLAKLDRLQRKSLNPAKLVERSIINSWQDIYEPKSSDEDEYRTKPRLTL